MRTILAIGLAGVALACHGSGTAIVPSPVDTAAFDGEYELLAEASFSGMRQQVASDPDEKHKQIGLQLLERQAEQYSQFTVHHGVIRSGKILVQELSLISGVLAGHTWQGKALWHEDAHDPGDASEVGVRITLDGDRLEFVMLNEDSSAGDPVVLQRVK